MISLVIPLIAVVLGGTEPSWCGQPFGVGRRERVAAPSLAGLPGLFEVPAAVSAVDRSAMLAFNTIHTTSIPRATSYQRNFFVGFGFLPRLTLIARGSALTNASNEGMRDISASAQVLVAREGRWTPSLAIGAQDLGGAAPNFETRYLVASKTILGRARATAGIGRKDSYSLDGPFGGIEIAPCPWISAIGENSGARHNFGVRLAPLGSWGADRGIEPSVDVLWREGQGRVISAGLRLQPPVRREQTDRGSAAAAGARPAPIDLTPADFSSLEAVLVAHGFENVRVSRAGDTVSVSYENRVFNRDEWDALGVVFKEMTRRAGTASVMRATILRLDLAVMQVISPVDAFRALVAGALEPHAFAERLIVRYPSAIPDGGAVVNPSRFHLDLTVRPRVESLLLTEISDAETRLSFLPEASLHLGRGLSVTARRALVAYTSSLFPAEMADPNADQLLLHLARPGLPFLGPNSGVVSQLSVGRFGHEEVGAALASDAVLSEGRISLGGVVAVFGARAGQLDRSVALGSLRYRTTLLDLTTSVTAGRFFHGDVGAVVELERRFGLAEVAMFAQGTDFAKMVGARVSLPLTLARDGRPGPIRVRLPEYYDHRKRTQVMNEINVIRSDVAEPLETGQDLARVFRGRDRINDVWLRRGAEAIRDAARRW